MPRARRNAARSAVAAGVNNVPETMIGNRDQGFGVDQYRVPGTEATVPWDRRTRPIRCIVQRNEQDSRRQAHMKTVLHIRNNHLRTCRGSLDKLKKTIHT